MIKKTYAIYCREYDAFLYQMPIKSVHKILTFRCFPERNQEKVVRSIWVAYEKLRRLKGRDIPEVEIVLVQGRRETEEVKLDITALDIRICDYYAITYGETFGIYAEHAFRSGLDIKHAIERRGLTFSKTKNAFPTSFHFGPYSFFDNEEDYILAKIMLAGGNIKRTIDDVITHPEVKTIMRDQVEIPENES